MSGPDVNLILRSTRVVTPEGTRPAAVAVAGGTIDAVLPYDAQAPAGPGWRTSATTSCCPDWSTPTSM